MDPLQQLLRVRELRLDGLRAELARELAALRAVDEELTVAASEVARAALQRTIWEHDWQQWLRHDGVLRHGQDYNLSHVALSAWEQDAREVHDEIAVRREQAAVIVGEVRQRVLQAERRCAALREQLQTLRRQWLARHAALMDSRANDEAAARRVAV